MNDRPVRKVFVQTHGCQMNEYDSARMLDLLRESHGLQATDNADEADVLLLNTCSIREKAQEKVFHQLGRWRKLKQERPGLVIGVGGCVASQEGGDIGRRAPYVDLVFGPQTLHRLPEMLDTALAGERRGPVVDISFPEIEKFDRLPEPSVSGRERLRLGDGRLQQVLQLLRGALHARRGSQPPAGRRARRDRAPRRPGRSRGEPARAERQRLPRPQPPGRDHGLRRAAAPGGSGGGHRAHPLHHLASARVQRCAGAGLRAISRRW